MGSRFTQRPCRNHVGGQDESRVPSPTTDHCPTVNKVRLREGTESLHPSLTTCHLPACLHQRHQWKSSMSTAPPAQRVSMLGFSDGVPTRTSILGEPASSTSMLKHKGGTEMCRTCLISGLPRCLCALVCSLFRDGQLGALGTFACLSYKITPPGLLKCKRNVGGMPFCCTETQLTGGRNAGRVGIMRLRKCFPIREQEHIPERGVRPLSCRTALSLQTSQRLTTEKANKRSAAITRSATRNRVQRPEIVAQANPHSHTQVESSEEI